MFYFIGDIHGYFDELISLFRKINKFIQKEDTLIFLGDYIDRGKQSYEVIEFLIALSKKYNTVFLLGNHEDMFMKYIQGEDPRGIFLYNGGRITIASYKRNYGKFELPLHHQAFFDNLKYYYEGEDFIAVHAGLNPNIEDLKNQSTNDMLWIRDDFFRSGKIWEKTIIFGHTPTTYFNSNRLIYINDECNIIGIDSGVIFGRELSCLRWPDRKVFHS